MEKVVAEAGIDIGGTLIGMHLRPVVVPVRLSISKIGGSQHPLCPHPTQIHRRPQGCLSGDIRHDPIH